MERLVKFEVLGQTYPLYTDAPEEDIEEILELVKSHIEENSKSKKSVLPSSKSAVLTSLNIAGKYVSLKRDFAEHKKIMGQFVERLIAKIESSLAEEDDRQDEGAQATE